MKNTNSANVKGFTLTELIVVIAIIVVMLGMFGYGVSGMMRDDKQKTGDQYAKQLHSAIQDWLIDMETNGVDVFMPNSYYTGNATQQAHTRYATICSYQWPEIGTSYSVYGKNGPTYPGDPINPADATDPSKGMAINVGGEMKGWKRDEIFYNPWIIKDWMFSGDAAFRVGNGLGNILGNGTLPGNTLPHGYTGSMVNPKIDHDLTNYIKSDDMLRQSGSWLAVIDTEQMVVLWTYWFGDQGRAFTDNGQRFYNESYVIENGASIADPSPVFGGTGGYLMYHCQEWLYKEQNDIICCYPMADEMGQDFTP